MALDDDLLAVQDRLTELTGYNWEVDLLEKHRNHCTIWSDVNGYHPANDDNSVRWKRDKALDYLDSIIASIESGLNQEQDEETRQLLEACTTTALGNLYAVIDTPNRPDRYYAGAIVDIDGTYYPRDSGMAARFHDTIEKASLALLELMGELGE